LDQAVLVGRLPVEQQPLALILFLVLLQRLAVAEVQMSLLLVQDQTVLLADLADLAEAAVLM
jgi:hypothetical protein